jgi:hypothetical protein
MRGKEVPHGLSELDSHGPGEKAWENLANGDGANPTTRLLKSDEARGREEGECTGWCGASKPEGEGRVEERDVGRVAEERVPQVLREPP